MQFSIKNNVIYFRDYDMSEYMNVKEINIDVETNEAFIVAEFKANVDYKVSGILALMLDNMSEENLLDVKSEVDFRIKDL